MENTKGFEVEVSREVYWFVTFTEAHEFLMAKVREGASGGMVTDLSQVRG